ncbi:hypothetical protein [Paraburkholderia youngii]|uniref:hypothetical protein n=1 Tax=Paraburkholderia youngii TaxID=2782701 RepID=UPI003D1A6FDA
MKELAQFVRAMCEALGKLVSVLQRNPTGAMALIAMLALVVVDFPLVVVLKCLTQTS